MQSTEEVCFPRNTDEILKVLLLLLLFCFYICGLSD